MRKSGEWLDSQPENSVMSQMQTPAESLTSKIVPEAARLSMLPRYFGRYMLAVESAIYDALGELCESYQGGFWNYYTVSNDSFFMAPVGASSFKLVCAGNWFEGELSAEATGIVASLIGINRACWQYRDQQLIDRFYALREYALIHPEASQIMAAID